MESNLSYLTILAHCSFWILDRLLASGLFFGHTSGTQKHFVSRLVGQHWFWMFEELHGFWSVDRVSPFPKDSLALVHCIKMQGSIESDGVVQ